MDYVNPPTSESSLILPSSLLASASSTILHLNKSSPIIDVKSNFSENDECRFVEKNITSLKDVTACFKIASTSTTSSSIKLEQPQNILYSEPQHISFGTNPINNRNSDILTVEYSSINKNLFNPPFPSISTSSQQQQSFHFDYSAYPGNVSNLHEGLMAGIGPSMGFYDLAAAAALMTGASNSNYYYENISNYPQSSYYYPFDGISTQNTQTNIYLPSQVNSTQRRSIRCNTSLPLNSSKNITAAKDAVTSSYSSKINFISSYSFSNNESLYTSVNSENTVPTSLGFLILKIN